MTDGRRIFRNFSVLMAAQLVSNIAGLVSTAWLARALLPEGFGVLGWGAAVIGYLGMVVNPGIDRDAMREIARDHDFLGRAAGNVLGFRLLMAAFAYAVLLLSVWLFGPDGQPGIVLMVQGAGLFVTAITVDFAFQGLQEMGRNAARQIMASLTALAGMLLLVSASEDVAIAAGVTVAATGLSALVFIFPLARRSGGLRLRLEKAVLLPMLRRAIPVGIAGFLTVLFVSADLVMMGFLSTAEEVGLYHGAARLFMLAILPASIMGAAFIPQMTSLRDDPAGRQRSMEAHARSVALAGAMVAAGGFACAGPLVTILFGDDYLDGIPVVRLLMIAAGIGFLRLCYDAPLMAWGQDRWRINGLVAGAVLNIGLNLFLIPRYHGLGAAVATIASELVVLLFYAGRRGWFSLKPVAWIQFRAFVIACLTAVAAFLVAGMVDGNAVLSLAAGAVTVLVAGGLLGIAAGIYDPRQIMELAGRK
jgi:O-antigen/teichoic acid export membrane protein